MSTTDWVITLVCGFSVIAVVLVVKWLNAEVRLQVLQRALEENNILVKYRDDGIDITIVDEVDHDCY